MEADAAAIVVRVDPAGNLVIEDIDTASSEDNQITIPTLKRVLSAGAPVPNHVLQRMLAAIPPQAAELGQFARRQEVGASAIPGRLDGLVHWGFEATDTGDPQQRPSWPGMATFRAVRSAVPLRGDVPSSKGDGPVARLTTKAPKPQFCRPFGLCLEWHAACHHLG